MRSLVFRVLFLAISGIVLFLVAGCTQTSAPPSAETGAPPSAEKHESARDWIEQMGKFETGARPNQIVASLTAMEQDASWEPEVETHHTRAASLSVYPKLAPAVVAVHTGVGHGTGFVVDPEGWIVTNHHVIVHGTPDPETGATTASVHFGKLSGGWMKLIDEPVPAVVYKSSPERDLALLKITKRPSGLETLPVVKLADTVPPPGSDCVAIGHPKRGVLWTARSGEVAGAGSWPTDQIEVVMAAISSDPATRAKLSTSFAAASQRKILLSTCGINPGDSGGPLADKEGRLIGVTFAVPTNDDPGVSLGKFSYHVHLEEVKAFLTDRPEKPAILTPNPWPQARCHKLVDIDGDGKPDALVFGLSEKGPVTGMLVKLSVDDVLKSIVSKLLGSDSEDQWQFNYAWQVLPMRRTFYDTDGDGKIDLVLTDTNNDEKAEAVIRLVEGKWQAEAANGRKMVDASYFTNKALADRFKALKLDQMK